MTHEKQRETLTPAQKRFVKEYPLDFNGSAAYMRASGTTNKKSASVQASKLLRLPKIKEAIEGYVQEQLGPLEKDLLGNVRFWVEIRDNEEARPADRLKASEMLAKYRAMFVEKHDHNVSGSIQIVDDIK